MKFLTLFIALVFCSSVLALKEKTKRDSSVAARVSLEKKSETLMPRELSKILFKRNNRQVSKIDYALISHSNLIVLEFLNISNFDNCIRENRYPTKTQFCEIYQLKDQTLRLKYKNLIGEKVYLYDHYFKRNTYLQSIIDVVLVHDRHQESPYIAAVTDIDTEKHIYYAWASSKLHDIEQFGEKIAKDYNYGDEITESYHDLINLYKSSDYYVDLESKIGSDSEDEYTRIDVTEFNSKFGDYVILENKSIGMCEFLTVNHLVLYKKQDAQYRFLASSKIDEELIDVIDVEQDGFPEIITGAFTSSSIYQFEGRKMNLLKAASWSFEGCPC